MPRKIWRLAEILLMLLGIFAIAVLAMRARDGEMRRAVEPPWSVQTLDDFRKWRPQYERALRLEFGNASYYLVSGEPARLLASGPSAYLFDARGHLVGWSLDIGDEQYLRVATNQSARKGTLGIAEIPVQPAAGAR